MGASPPAPPVFSPPSQAQGLPGFRIPLVGGLQELPPRPFLVYLGGHPPEPPGRGQSPLHPGFSPFMGGLQELPLRSSDLFLWMDTSQAPGMRTEPLPPPIEKWGWSKTCLLPGGSGNVPPKRQRAGASWHLLKPAPEWDPEAGRGRRERGWEKRKRQGDRIPLTGEVEGKLRAGGQLLKPAHEWEPEARLSLREWGGKRRKGGTPHSVPGGGSSIPGFL